MVDVKISEYRTYTDWGLLLAPSFSVGVPTTRTKWIEVPGSDGEVDFTDALSGRPTYSMRTLTWATIFPPPESDWEEKRLEIVKYCHGKAHKIWMPGDDAHYFTGRVECENYAEEGSALATLGFSAICQPWKLKNQVTTQTVNLSAGETQSIILSNEQRPVAPTWTVSGASINVSYAGTQYAIGIGTQVLANLVLEAGQNVLEISSADVASIFIEYQEGVL